MCSPRRAPNVKENQVIGFYDRNHCIIPWPGVQAHAWRRSVGALLDTRCARSSGISQSRRCGALLAGPMVSWADLVYDIRANLRQVGMIELLDGAGGNLLEVGR